MSGSAIRAENGPVRNTCRGKGMEMAGLQAFPAQCLDVRKPNGFRTVSNVTQRQCQDNQPLGVYALSRSCLYHCLLGWSAH